MSLISRGKITPMALAIVIVVGVVGYIAFAGANPCIINAGSMGAIGDEPLHMVGSDCPPPQPTEKLIPATEQQCTELNAEWEEWREQPSWIRSSEEMPAVMYYWEPASWSVNHEIDMCYMIDISPDSLTGERVRVPILQLLEIDEAVWIWSGEYAFGAAECEQTYFSGGYNGLEKPNGLRQLNFGQSEWVVCSTGVDTNENGYGVRD